MLQTPPSRQQPHAYEGATVAGESSVGTIDLPVDGSLKQRVLDQEEGGGQGQPLRATAPVTGSV